MHSAGTTEHAHAGSMLNALGAQLLGEIPPKTVLYEEGAPALGFYYLEKGIVQLHTSEAPSANFILELLVPGDVFGEDSLTAAGAYGAIATVLVRSSILWIPPPGVRGGTGEHPEAWAWIADRLVGRHLRALHRFRSICRQDVSKRILAGLLELARWCPGKDGCEATLPLSQAALAQLICSTRETVSTKLNRLAAQDLVQLSPSRIGIPSVGRLKEVLSSTTRASG